MHVPNISYNRSTSGSLKRAQTPCRHEGSTCKDNSFSVTRFSISNPPSENPAYGPDNLYRTLFRVLHKTVRVPDRAAVIAHGQESFYLFCSVTRVTKVSELFFPAKTSAIKNL